MKNEKQVSSKDKLEEFFAKYEGGEKKLPELFSLYLKEQEERRSEYFKTNPIDAPNHVLNHAIIEGIEIRNDKVLSKGDYFHLFDVGVEKFYIWTYQDDVNSILIVDVSPDVKKEEMWKTAVSILEIAFTIMNELEQTQSFGYDWIYRFNHRIEIEQHHYLKDRFNVKDIRIIIRLLDFKNIINLIELLYRDNKYYVASQNIIAAKENHDFCQICALTPEHYKKHFDKEPEIWERASLIPKMEAAIVQTTRSVEAIMGKPGNKDNPLKLRKAKERWRDSIDLDPDENFRMVGKTYIEYYYDLFSLRAGAAHSFGKLSFNMSRSLTIEAQSFAWIIILKYYEKNCVTEEIAIKRLNFNLELVSKFSENFSTNVTRKKI